MRYRIKNGPWIEYCGPQSVEPLNKKGDVLVVIDPGKTNMAVAIGNPRGGIYTFVEMSGKDCDTTQYCADVKAFFNRFLSNVKVYRSGVEAAVSYKGMEYHISQMVLTEIRGALLSYFLENHGSKPTEINNYSWKSAVLPDGYRGHKEKGSLRFLNEQGFTGITHDVSDVLCMYLYFTKLVNYDKPLRCDTAEKFTGEYSFSLNSAISNGDGCETVSYNTEFSLEENIAYALHRTISKLIRFIVPTEVLTVRDVYGASKVGCESVKVPDKIEVVVLRTS